MNLISKTFSKATLLASVLPVSGVAAAIPSKLLRLAALGLALPLLGTCAAISVNAVCYVGNCDSPDSIGVGQTSKGSFNFLYTFADGDQYSISGDYNNTYPDIHTSFEPTVTYLNNNGNIFTPSVQSDSLALVMFQNIYDPVGSSWDGKYCQTIPFDVTTLARANGNTYFDGNGIGFLNAPTGLSTQSNCSNLSFTAAQNASATMMTQTFLSFTFFGGNLAGAYISDPPTDVPEPSQFLPIAFALVALVGFASYRATRRMSKHNETTQTETAPLTQLSL